MGGEGAWGATETHLGVEAGKRHPGSSYHHSFAAGAQKCVLPSLPGAGALFPIPAAGTHAPALPWGWISPLGPSVAGRWNKVRCSCQLPGGQLDLMQCGGFSSPSSKSFSHPPLYVHGGGNLSRSHSDIHKIVGGTNIPHPPQSFH